MNMRAGLGALLAGAVLAASSVGAAEPEGPAPGFVDAAAIVPGLVVDMRYHGRHNFVGRPIAGYDAPVCLLSMAAAEALARVQARLRPQGLGLKVFDCYRPARAVADFVQWARDPHDQRRKAAHYPKLGKSELFARGYIAEKSGHSRGSTVDVTLVDLATGRELDMGTAYDWFGPEAWPTARSPKAEARAHRLALQLAMIETGFTPYPQEWWHFTLANEPFAAQYFDFPIRKPTTGAAR
jgi:D-alanyl-D-alanine dipeptidase